MKSHQHMRSMTLGLAGGACLVAAAIAVAAHADGPPTTSPLFYAGTIEDNGVLVDGDVPIGLALFDDEDTGAPETRLCDVPSANRPVTRGRFRIDASACLGAVTANGDVFVEVTVRGTPLPRQKLGAVPYAIEAERAQSATIAEAVAAGSVDAAAIAAGAVGSVAMGNGVVDNSALADDAVTAPKLAPDAVGARELADNSVDSGAILDASVLSAKIAANAVGAVQLADNAVDSAAVAADALTSADIASNAVTFAELADNAVDTTALQDGAVSAAKLGAGAIGNQVRRTTNCTPNSVFSDFRDCSCSTNEFAISGGGSCDTIAISRNEGVSGLQHRWIVGCRDRVNGGSAPISDPFAICLRVAP